MTEAKETRKNINKFDQPNYIKSAKCKGQKVPGQMQLKQKYISISQQHVTTTLDNN